MWAAACARLESEVSTETSETHESDVRTEEVWEAKRMDRQEMRAAVGEFLLDP